MANIMTPPSYDYEGWRAVLNGKDRRKIGHNTYAVLDDVAGDTVVRILYHSTYIVSFHHNGEITLNTNGWETLTTKQRMNAVLPSQFEIFQRKHVWYLHDRVTDTEVKYKDHVSVGMDAGILGGQE